MIRPLRDEVFLLLEGRGAILETAREVTRVLRDAALDGAVIGGVAVVLHGYWRTTSDVDVFVPGDLRPMGEALRKAGFRFNRPRREFTRKAVPVYLVTKEQTRTTPREFIEVDGVQTVCWRT